jgi:integrase
MRSKEAFLIFTDDQCVIAGTVYSGLPMLINSDDRILEAPSDWLRHLTVMQGEAKGSVRQFAYHLKYWWSHLNQVNKAWDDVNDFVLLNWREELLRGGCIDKVVNSYVSTVFRFYLWAERNGYTHGLIGEADWEQQVHPPLTVEIKVGPKRTKSYSSPILKRTIAQPLLPIPTNDEITKVHEALAELHGVRDDLLVRDTLILTWMEQTGVRRNEVVTLNLSQIPEWDEIERLQEVGDNKEISIVGKGGKKRSIWAGTDLLFQTQEYIVEERQSIVDHFRERLGSTYKKPKAVFLSSKSGRQLHPDSISQTFAKAFRKAGVGGSGHRVRARFLTNLTENAFESEFERRGSIPDLVSTLLPVAQIAGHSRVETLIPYVGIAKKRMLKQTAAERTAVMEQRAIAVERRLAVNLMKLHKANSISDLTKSIESGNKKRIKNELEKLLGLYS